MFISKKELKEIQTRLRSLENESIAQAENRMRYNPYSTLKQLEKEVKLLKEFLNIELITTPEKTRFLPKELSNVQQ